MLRRESRGRYISGAALLQRGFMGSIKVDPRDQVALVDGQSHTERYGELLAMVISRRGSFSFRPEFADWIYMDSNTCTCSHDPFLVLRTIEKWYAKKAAQ